MAIDVIATERHFLDHVAPVWRRLPLEDRGRIFTDAGLRPYAARLGLRAEAWRDEATPRGEDHPTLVASYGDLKRARMLERSRLAFLEHGAGQSYAGSWDGVGDPHYSGGRDRDDVELTLVPGPHPAARWRDRYPAMRVVEVGCPKLDELPRREVDQEPIVALSFHFNAQIGPEEANGAWRHYADVLPSLREFRLVGHAHPRHAPRLRSWFERAGVEWIPDFADVCRRASVYVCDNSSTIFEFAATGRPVVLLNAPWYRRDVEHGLRFWAAAGVGVQVDEPAELAAAIRTALLDPAWQRRKREDALDLVYAYRSGAAERAVAELAAWAA